MATQMQPNADPMKHGGAARRWLLRRWDCVPSLNASRLPLQPYRFVMDRSTYRGYTVMPRSQLNGFPAVATFFVGVSDQGVFTLGDARSLF